MERKLVMFISWTLQESSSDKGLSMGWIMSYKILLNFSGGKLEPPDSKERYSQDIMQGISLMLVFRMYRICKPGFIRLVRVALIMLALFSQLESCQIRHRSHYKNLQHFATNAFLRKLICWKGSPRETSWILDTTLEEGCRLYLLEWLKRFTL